MLNENKRQYLIEVFENGAKQLASLLCEFARKKENPSRKRYIAPLSALSVVYFPLCTAPACGCLRNDRKLLS
jgi:hypothetical protein